MNRVDACPFCAASETEIEFINSTTWCFQRCKACGATGPRVCAGHGGDSTEAWNRRAPIAAGGGEALTERIDGLITSTYEKDGDGYYDTPLTLLLRDLRAALSTAGAAEPVKQLGAGSEHDLHNVLKSVLFHFGTEGAPLVTKDAIDARPVASPPSDTEEKRS